jgi:ribosomal-protein-alanine N-acetyltransferase
MMVDEAHITTFAVMPQWRRHGIGGRLMVELMRLARDLNARVATLEVRITNGPARSLYGQFGFRPVGVRPRYYTDNGEDALIMTTDELSSPQMQERLAALELRYDEAPIDAASGTAE